MYARAAKASTPLLAATYAGRSGSEPSALQKGRSIALEHAQGGRVSATEIGDEEGYYEIEVTRQDGTQVDVYRNPQQGCGWGGHWGQGGVQRQRR
jgi:uncharacterized membrane protein YkoI